MNAFHSRLFLFSLFSLGVLLSACGNPAAGQRSSWEAGPVSGTSQDSLFSDGSFGCQAIASRSEVYSGDVFTVTVSIFNAQGTAKLTNGKATADSNGILSYTTSYSNNTDGDILWAPMVRVSDSKSTASCQFQIYILPQPFRGL
jgi:hypothetical protein